jgi:hemoglobin-like flavoprotein
MIGEHVTAFQASVNRCLASSSFISDFYDRFTGTSEAIREKFEKTDFARQHQAMADSLYLMAVSVQGGPANLARLDMKRLYAKHQGMDIRASMYDVWLECLVETARVHDPEYTPAIEFAWRQCLAPGIAAMKSGAPYEG